MEFISRYVIPFKGFSYEPGSVICTLVDCGINGRRQYLLEPQPLSIPETVGHFAVLPDDLEIKAMSASGPDGIETIGKIRQCIRDLNKYHPGPDALALRTEVVANHRYQLMPNHYEMVGAWVVELARFLGKNLRADRVVFSREEYARLGNIPIYEAMITCEGDDVSHAASVGLDPYGNLWEMRSDLDPEESIVWSKTDRMLFHGARPTENSYIS